MGGGREVGGIMVRTKQIRKEEMKKGKNRRTVLPTFYSKLFFFFCMHVSSLQVVSPPIFFKCVVLGAANEEGTWLHNSNCSFASARLRIRRTKQKAKVLFFFFLRKLRKEKEAFFECPPFFPLRDAKKKRSCFLFSLFVVPRLVMVSCLFLFFFLFVSMCKEVSNSFFVVLFPT